MVWILRSGVLGNATATMFQNTATDQLNPQTLYSVSPFINNSSKQFQYITSTTFLTFSGTTSSTFNLVANASSGLPITYTSSNPTIMSIVGNVATLNFAGKINITASQAGDATYNDAAPFVATVTINLVSDYQAPNTYYSSPSFINLSSPFQLLKAYQVVMTDIRYTRSTGIAYGFNTGLKGVVLYGTINATNSSNAQVTSFGANPITITLTLPHANTNNRLVLYHRTGAIITVTQPTGYPVPLTYNSGTGKWTGTMTNLSSIVVIDNSAPSGNAGGDPYIVSVRKIKTLIPNTWKNILLFRSDDVSVVAHCKFLDQSIINNLHYINKAQNIKCNIDITKHKWVRDITYIHEVECFANNDKNNRLLIDTINCEVISDSSTFLHEKNKNAEYGLYSITHGGYYPIMNFKQICIYFDDGYLALSVDNYWDDINYIQLYLNNNDYDNYSGELIEHSEINAYPDDQAQSDIIGRPELLVKQDTSLFIN